MSTTTPEATPVSVIGLGQMGSAIARTLIEQGHPVTVWNRTAGRTAPLVEAGAVAAQTAAEAVAASPLVVVSVLDGSAVDEVFTAIAPDVAGKVLVNLTSGSPQRARAHEEWAHEHGAAYLDGKIMGDPPYVGSPALQLPISGSRAAFDVHERTLRELGTVTYRGQDAGLAAVWFLAEVAVAYELLIGFLHGLRLVQAEGVDVTEFADQFAGNLSGYPALLTSIAKGVGDRAYPPDLGPLRVQAALMDDLIEHREAGSVEAVRMREVKELMDRQIAAGHGEQGFASLFELIAGQK